MTTHNLTEEQLMTIIHLATIDGFAMSCEGGNAEYPYEFNEAEIKESKAFVPTKGDLKKLLSKAKKKKG